MIYPTYLNGIKVSGSGVPHISLTQAQYDALSVEAKNNGTIYFITDAVGGSGDFAFIQNGDCYSTEERMIGCWVDGKPLYQKTWIRTVPNTTGFFEWTDGVPSDLEVIVETSYSVRNIGEQGETPWYASASIYFDAMTNRAVSFYTSGTYNAGHPLIFTAKYTKSSDRAGSGSWTPNGMPAIHYSTSEQIIGTWIDGSTLYEKTVNFGAIPNRTTKEVAHGITNLGRIVDISGIMKASDAFETLPSGENSNFRVLVVGNIIRIITSANWNDWSESYITLRYTKS